VQPIYALLEMHVQQVSFFSQLYSDLAFIHSLSMHMFTGISVHPSSSSFSIWLSMNAPKDLFHIYASITIDQSRNQVSIYFGSESISKTKKGVDSALYE